MAVPSGSRIKTVIDILSMHALPDSHRISRHYGLRVFYPRYLSETSFSRREFNNLHASAFQKQWHNTSRKPLWTSRRSVTVVFLFVFRRLPKRRRCSVHYVNFTSILMYVCVMRMIRLTVSDVYWRISWSISQLRYKVYAFSQHTLRLLLS